MIIKRIGRDFSVWGRLRIWVGLALLLQPILAQGDGALTNLSFTTLSKLVATGGVVVIKVDGTIIFDNALAITRDTVIDAEGRTMTFDGQKLYRLFNVSGGATLGLNNLTLRNGSSDSGGAIKITGATLLATNCDFTSNQAIGANGGNGSPGQNSVGEAGGGKPGGDGYPALGGAVFNTGTVRLTGCSFQQNTATGGTGGTGGDGGDGTRAGIGGIGGDGGTAFGGGIYSEGKTYLTNCLFTANAVVGGIGGAGGASGSGLYGYDGRSGAGADGGGGGVFNLGTLLVYGSTFYTNTATGGKAGTDGGTINNGAMGGDGLPGGDGIGAAIDNQGTAIVIQSTFNANLVTGGDGGNGGVGGFGPGAGGDGGYGFGGAFNNWALAGITNCTFATNAATGGKAGNAGSGFISSGNPGLKGAGRGANLSNKSGQITLKNTIVAYPGEGANAYGVLTDAGGNISSDKTCKFTAASSRNSTDPMLEKIADNGGLTQTMALRLGSPAINAALPLDWLTTDQRGVTRPQGSGYDIGAYEFVLYAIRGRVFQGTNGLAGVKITLSGDAQKTTTSDVNGNYAFTNLVAGVYDVSPPTTGLGFSPASRDINFASAPADALKQDFVANAARIVSYQFTGTTNLSCVISGLGLPSRAYLWQVSSDLVNWAVISTNKSDASGNLQLKEIAPHTASRFYRFALP
jgi:hypothetical protein